MKTDFCLLDHLAAMRVGELEMLNILVIKTACHLIELLSVVTLGSFSMKAKAWLLVLF